jgi:hypothetical protein
VPTVQEPTEPARGGTIEPRHRWQTLRKECLAVEEITATILNGDRVLLTEVTVRVRPLLLPEGRTGWEGELTLPDGAHLSPGRNYAFEAADGRRGSIGVVRVCGGGPTGTTIEFRFNGPFDFPLPPPPVTPGRRHPHPPV